MFEGLKQISDTLKAMRRNYTGFESMTSQGKLDYIKQIKEIEYSR